MKKLIGLCACFILFLSCEKLLERVYTIFIYNDTNHNIAIGVSDLGEHLFYPDTLLPPKPEHILIEPSYSWHYSSFNKWEDNFENSPDDTLSIFFFHSDTLEAYSWEVIREEYKILKRYDLSLEDLQRLDFKVTYPPGPEMEGVKMYPEE